ncbi:hypothetical protein BDZ89DRAFT_1074872 [Hymenopellis radicata]|nr:hypothetical protein BDZ89DRAFT_1074872 [Hymenopellis radicata]
MSSTEESLRQMRAMLDFFAPLGSRVPQGQRPLSPASLDGHVVLVTGTTGFLGTGILAKLLDSPDVRRIYAVNRSSKDGTALEDRQKAAFEERGYDAMLLDSPKLLLVETSLTERGLGVYSRLEEDIRNSITHIIHNAWRVHFSLPLSSYKSILQGMRVLIDLALCAPNMNRFIFISTISIFNNVIVNDPNLPVAETPIDDGAVAIGTGYSESKWIAEQMLYRIAKEFSHFRPLIVRAGVISGAPNGAWNPTDFVPAVVKLSVHSEMRCLPEYPGQCSWIPLDLTARAIIDFMNSTADVNTVHLVHPKVQPLVDIMHWKGKSLGLPVIPFPEWTRKLGLLSTDNRGDILALRVIPFIKDQRRDNGLTLLTLGTHEALCLSASLREAEPLSPIDVASWVSYWAKTGYLPPSVADAAGINSGCVSGLSRL